MREFKEPVVRVDVTVQDQAPRVIDGLRIYQNTEMSESWIGHGIFYSRREAGPYYRWFFEEKGKKWRVTRVQSSSFSPGILFKSPWKTIPTGLQKSIVEHYQD